MTAPQLLLLTGIPGTGKTCIGNYLRDHHGFAHLDFETPTLLQYVDQSLRANEQQVSQLAQSGKDTVITWGFLPREQLDAVLTLRAHGFQWFWLDGNRDAARQAFLRRGTVSEQLLDLQLERIAHHLEPQMEALAPLFLNPFDQDGKHRPLAEIARELLGLPDQGH